jgi:hypothetical protein
MTIVNAASQSQLLIATRAAATNLPRQGRCFWKELLMALMRALSGWAV